MESRGDDIPIIRVFGGTGVDSAEGPISIGGARQRRLLALLAIRANSVVDIDWLAEYLWSDADRPEATAPALRTYVSRLRQALPVEIRDWVETEPSGYRLSAPEEAVEHSRFVMLRTRARSAREVGDPETALRFLDEALGMWRGDPFRELEDLDWAQAEIEGLRLDRLEMLEERWEAALDLGRHTQITGELAAFTAEHGMRERAARQYALALYRSGRTADALRVLDEHRRALAGESGLDPSPAFAELEDAILSGDPSLDIEKDGRPLRGYRLLDEIGSGAFATVWRAVQPSVDREVAIKQIRAELASQPEFIRRFEAEAHLVARIEHPHIVPLIDYWRDPDSAYLVMRWLRGGTLERLLDDGPIPVERTVEIAEQVGAALTTAHGHGVVHRDVKTSNIMFDEQGNAYLADFGIALAVAESGGPEAALSPGTPAYASPEQLRREPLGPQADVFSLGVVVYECLAGSLPFGQTPSAGELVDRQLTEPYPSLSEAVPGVPGAVADAVARATAKDPAARFASVADFLDALRLHDTPRAETTTAADGRPLIGAVENPYLGLRAFDDADADRFFGRRRLISELVDRLSGDTVTSRCLVVVGPSGSGKSSVVRAGLIPAVRSGAIPGSEKWFTTTMVPGVDPFESLEAALLRIAVNPPATLLDQLKDGPRGVLRSVRRCLADDSQRVLLAVDQFEEMFVGTSADRAAAFLDALAVAVQDPVSPLRLVATLRADYYHRPLEHPTFAPILKQAAIDVTPLAPDELEEAITEPSHQVGVAFEPGLVARIAAETLGQPSPLPLLQYALSELFERRDGGQLTVESYEKLGGLAGALAARAEALYAGADDTQRSAIRRTFGRLTDPSEERADLRRRVAIADLGEEPSVAWTLEQFGQARLISFDHDVVTREPTVEVAHEALLREWPRLVTWLEDDRDLLRSVDLLASAATTWDRAGRQPADLYRGGRLETALDLALDAPQRLRTIDSEFIDASRSQAEADHEAELQRVRRLRRLNIGVSLALVVALIAGGLAVTQRNQAQAATEAAELSTLMSRSAALARDDVDLAILLALEAHRRSPGTETERAIVDALSNAAGRTAGISLPNDPADPCAIRPNHLWVSQDGLRGFQTVGDRMLSIDFQTGDITDHGQAPEPCVMWLGDEARGTRWAGSTRDARLHWFGPFDGPLVEVEQEVDFKVVGRSMESDRLLFVVPPMTSRSSPAPPSSDSIQLIDVETGAIVGEGVDQVEESQWRPWATSPDGRLVAIAQAVPGSPGVGWVTVLEAQTGERTGRFTIEQPPTALAFEGSDTLVVGGLFGRLTTIDLQSGTASADVPTTATSGFQALGVRPDGLIVAVSKGQIELVDRAIGPVGAPINLSNASEAHVRPDGTILVLDYQSASADIIDPDNTPLVEKAWDVDPLATVQIEAGVAGVVDSEGNAGIIDLATGTRSALVLDMPADRDFELATIFPDANDVIGMGTDATIGRWSNGDLVEFVELGSRNDGPSFYREDRLDIGSGPGPGFAGLGSVVVHSEYGYEDEAYLVDWDTGPIAVQLIAENFAVESSLPTGDGGVHMVSDVGRIRTYDSSGRWQSELVTGLGFPWAVARDESSGLIALGGAGGAVVVDPESEVVQPVPGLGNVTSVAFIPGSVLVVVEADGTVRLWDIEAGASAGVLWNGSGGGSASPPWYDASTKTLWVATSGKLIQFNLDPEAWIERACEIVGRNLTQDEWDRYVPGDEPLVSACD